MDLPSFKSEKYNYEFVPGDIEELIRWCHEQAKFYEQINDNASSFYHDANLQSVYSKTVRLASLKEHADKLEKLSKAQDSEEIESELENIASVVKTAFEQHELPPAHSEVGQALSIHLEKDPAIGLPAIFSLSPRQPNHNHQFSYWYPEIWRGLGIGAVLSTRGTFANKPQKIAKPYRELVSSAQADLGRTRAQAVSTLRDLRANINSFKEKESAFEEQHTATVKNANEAIDKLVKDCTDDIGRFRTLVKSEIALKAPVTYWEEKAVNHENKAFYFAWLTIALMFLASVLAIQTADIVKNLVGSGDKTSYAGIAIVAAVITLAFWALRLLVRIFLSQQHLGSDARERVAMVKTYLALREADLAPKDGDLAPVLVALFRPASDGMVKDEGMPPVLAEMLTRSK
jgi:hypothetical protein